MTHIHLISEEHATGGVEGAYGYIRWIYSKDLPNGESAIPVPDVFRAASLVAPYAEFSALQLNVMTGDGGEYLGSPDALVPRILPCFATALFSDCFY